MRNIAFLILSVFILIAAIACGESSDMRTLPYDDNEPMFLTRSGFSGDAPFDFTYFFAFNRSDEVSKIEMDFGEGEGYTDVTEICLDYSRGTGDIPVHRYQVAGQYSLKIKTTTITGKVSKYESGIIITVLPLDEGNGD